MILLIFYICEAKNARKYAFSDKVLKISGGGYLKFVYNNEIRDANI